MPKQLKRRTFESLLKERVPPACRGTLFIDHGIDLEAFRQLLGMAAKYILPPEHWGFQGDLDYPTILGLQFSKHESIRPFEEAFLARTSSDMQSDSPLNTCLRQLVKYTKGLDGKHVARKVRKKRITQTIKAFRKLLRAYFPADPMTSDQIKTSQGLVYFMLTVKRQFLRKES